MVASCLRDRIEQDGFAIVPGALSPETVEALRVALAAVASDEDRSVRRREAEAAGYPPKVGGDRSAPLPGIYAIRNLARVVPLVGEVAASAPVRPLAEAVLGPGASPVQALFLDKPPDANWKICRHRDRTFPVRARIDVPGFGPWSVKAGVPHAQLPEAVLEQLLIIRLHLDECTEENGALRVVPGSHRGDGGTEADGGRSPASPLPEEMLCRVPCGGALLMRPLLLHGSAAARVSGHRRVVHLVYAAGPLPGGLEWPALGS